MSKENQFTVDLGKLTLTDEHKKSINVAIQNAVTKELAHIDWPANVALVPVFKYGRGPIINGIIAWEHANLIEQAQLSVKAE